MVSLERIERPARQRRDRGDHAASVDRPGSAGSRLAPWRSTTYEAAGRLADDGRAPSSSGSARRSSRPARDGVRRLRRPPPARRAPAARRLDRLVGTKLILARERGALRNCGADIAAHCINDVITTGAEPLFLLDYVAAAASSSSRSPSSSRARPRSAARPAAR